MAKSNPSNTPSPIVSLQEFPSVTDGRKRSLLNALVKTMGIVTPACKAAVINRDTHYEWMKKDPVYAQAVKLIQESAIDFAETKLFELINGVTVQQQTPGGPVIYTREPNVAATIFYLKTKAKHRGYIEKLQIGDIGDDEQDTTLEI